MAELWTGNTHLAGLTSAWRASALILALLLILAACGGDSDAERGN